MILGLSKKIVGWDSRSESQKSAIKQLHLRARLAMRHAIASAACWLPIPLATLLRLSGSDKHQKNGHLYGHAYARWFGRFRYRKVKLLEIGIGGYGFDIGGQSLTAWQAYFPRGTVVACDIEDKSRLASRRTRIYQIDQSSKPDLMRLHEQEGPFDIIIDDGSHLSRHQIFTFQTLFDSLEDGGVYVIEDVMTSFWKFAGWDGAHVNEPGFSNTCVGYFMALAPYLNADEFEPGRAVNPALVKLASKIGSIQFEKNLVIIEKREGSKGETAIRRLHGS